MGSLVQVENISKRFGARLLYEGVSFGVAQGEKIGLIARNGAGKSTLLNIIAGREAADSGEVVFRTGLRVGYLEQSYGAAGEMTALEACLPQPAGDEEGELRARQMLSRLGIRDCGERMGTMSGGQQKRVALARALVGEPEFVMLDEPTNHLDLGMIEWLEERLGRASIGLLVVSHDRYFLDRVCNVIIEIDGGKIFTYRGNYSYFLEKRAERTEADRAAAERAAGLMRKELEWMRRQPQARATKAKSRVDAFYELEKRAAAKREDGSLRLDVGAAYIGSKIFEAEDVSKSFGDVKILEGFNYVFARYEKLGIVGANGTGKTTFVRMLLGEEMPDSGRIVVGETVKFGYYHQVAPEFDPGMKVIDVVRQIAEQIDAGDGRRVSASAFLSRFLFAPERQHDFVAKLSGGERRRLALCTALASSPNFLILDEPTNDLDIATLNVLEDYLCGFRGCVVVVSHDRYFLDRIVDHILVFEGGGSVRDFPGNYSQYRLSTAGAGISGEKSLKSNDKSTKSTYKSQKSTENPRRLSYREQRELESLEAGIPLLEAELSAVEQSLAAATLPADELTRLSVRHGELSALLDAQTERWLLLSE
ncbi:MAG: ABC-F family ATP-binding cassette domain-containing protein [Tannerella sp.]|nr:ABC-F family ATP-binding cassette domain-containing protein [Tannerella sp.]